MFIYDHCGTLKNPHIIRKGHEVPGIVAGLCESLGMGGYRERDMPLTWDLVSRSRITLHFGAKATKKKKKTKQKIIMLNTPR